MAPFCAHCCPAQQTLCIQDGHRAAGGQVPLQMDGVTWPHRIGAARSPASNALAPRRKPELLLFLLTRTGVRGKYLGDWEHARVMHGPSRVAIVTVNIALRPTRTHLAMVAPKSADPCWAHSQHEHGCLLRPLRTSSHIPCCKALGSLPSFARRFQTPEEHLSAGGNARASAELVKMAFNETLVQVCLLRCGQGGAVAWPGTLHGTPAQGPTTQPLCMAQLSKCKLHTGSDR